MLTIVSAGDFCAPLLTRKAIEHAADQRLFDDKLKEIISGADIATVNMEAPLTNTKAESPKCGPHIKAPPESIEAIKQAGFKFAVMANNHTMDYGRQGMEDTFQSCWDAGITTLGAGADASDAAKAVFVNKDNRTIALLAFAEHESGLAGKDLPGVAVFEPLLCSEKIRDARSKADIVIVNVHGGREYFPLPSPRFRAWCRSLVDAGADAVIGHHPHVIQGMEYYKGKAIVFSLGHLFFNWPVVRPGCWYEGIVSKIVFDGNAVRAGYVGCEQRDKDTDPRCMKIDGLRMEEFSNVFEMITKIIAHDVLYNDVWRAFCSRKSQGYYRNLKLTSSALKTPLDMRSAFKSRDFSSVISDLISKLMRPRDLDEQYKRRLLNLLVCPSHLDVLETSLENEFSGYKPSDYVRRLCDELNTRCRCGL